jgi:alanyl-tRNA synthetase
LTGLGLERIVSILNKTDDHYQTDLFKPIIDQVISISKLDYNYNSGIPHRVISDHIRMLCCTIADGVMPSNEGRGYVLRRIMRRGMRHAHSLGNTEPVFPKL